MDHRSDFPVKNSQMNVNCNYKGNGITMELAGYKKPGGTKGMETSVPWGSRRWGGHKGSSMTLELDPKQCSDSLHEPICLVKHGQGNTQDQANPAEPSSILNNCYISLKCSFGCKVLDSW